MNDPTDPPVTAARDDASNRPERPARPERPPAPLPVPATTLPPLRPAPASDSLSSRRTIIPILLTLSVLLGVIGTLTQTMPADSPLRAGRLAAAGFFMAAAGSVFLAVLNMRAVRKATRR
jgi:hypothetical protein